MIPLIIDFSRKKVVIFGGGSVSARKARYFLDEADLTIISRSFTDALTQLPVRRIIADTGALSNKEIHSYIDGAFLVIAALSEREENNRIGMLAARAGILFNNADGDMGDVIIPSIVRGRHLIAGFSTGGESPAVSRHLREHFEEITPEIDAMIDLQHILRDALKRMDLTQGERARRLTAAIRDPAIRKGMLDDRERTIEIAMSRYCHE
ncbi:precorrin-2 dehydrogenase/sirohydrochlorin ferrochelatase family protein [Methanocalculus sp. MC3]